MEKIFYLSSIFISVTILFSCNDNSASLEKSTEEQHELKEPSADTNSITCYGLNNGKDTVLMKIKIDEGQVSGDLMYHYFEKDKNTGTLKGKMIGDTLLGTYTFMSEGKESVRPVVFLKNGNEMIEGYGKLDSTTGEPDLADRSAIKFDNKFILKQTDCQ